MADPVKGKPSQAVALSADIAKMGKEELLALVASLQQQATQGQAGVTRIQVSQKGGISVYGIHRFPVTLYPTQWQKMEKILPDVLKFIEENKGKKFQVMTRGPLTDKDGKPVLDASGKQVIGELGLKDTEMSFQK